MHIYRNDSTTVDRLLETSLYDLANTFTDIRRFQRWRNCSERLCRSWTVFTILRKQTSWMHMGHSLCQLLIQMGTQRRRYNCNSFTAMSSPDTWSKRTANVVLHSSMALGSLITRCRMETVSKGPRNEELPCSLTYLMFLSMHPRNTLDHCSIPCHRGFRRVFGYLEAAHRRLAVAATKFVVRQ